MGKNGESIPSQRYAKKAERRRARRTARVVAGLCTHCGKPREDHNAETQRCDACVEKAKLQSKAKRDAKRVSREAEKEIARNAPDAPICPHCQGRRLRKKGFMRGKQRYHCNDCERLSYGFVPEPEPVLYPCPNPGCGGACIKMGRDARGKQRYFCRQCGHQNTGLWPTELDSPGGPFPHRCTFGLNIPAQQRLNAYCQRYGMSEIEAVRSIFRTWADEPVHPMADGRSRTLLPTPPREPIPASLPDLRPQSTRERWAAGGRYHLSVLVVQKLDIDMDDTAYQGLLRFMRKTGMNHQQAARYLISHAT